jgi:hypothetical protein
MSFMVANQEEAGPQVKPGVTEERSFDFHHRP